DYYCQVWDSSSYYVF
nr:immunoglobulin light chain junction region [Macaca mulatta]MOW58884.1 immunoglobulin light chain junction region [Macaca mulatta]